MFFRNLIFLQYVGDGSFLAGGIFLGFAEITLF